jgi:hypothetical protein
VASLEKDNFVAFYYISLTEIWSDKWGVIWREVTSGHISAYNMDNTILLYKQCVIRPVNVRAFMFTIKLIPYTKQILQRVSSLKKRELYLTDDLWIFCFKLLDYQIDKSYSFKFKKYLISTITMNCQIFNSQTWNWPLFWQTTASTLKKNV